MKKNIISSLIFGIFVLFVYGTTPTKVIADIKNWQHPTRKVFEQAHIDINKVELYDKTYPVFYVSLPSIATVKDKAQFENIVRKLAKANAYWNFSIIDDVIENQKIEVKVICDRANKTVKEINYVSGEKFFENNEFRYKRTFSTSVGELNIFDNSVSSENNIYSLSLGNIDTIIQVGEYSIDTVINLKLPPTNRAFLLVQYNGPGMNCHEQYRIIEVNSKKIQCSDPFGSCMDFVRTSISQDTVYLKMKSTTSESDSSKVTWANGRITE